MGIETTPVEKNKKEKYLELFHGEPDAIFVLSGDIVEMNDRAIDFGKKVYGDIAAVSGDLPKWRSTAFSDLDPHGGISGGAFRIHAAAKAARVFPKSLIVTTTRDLPRDAHLGRPVHAKVMAEEMKRRGIGEDRIILEEKSINTRTAIKEMLLLVVKNHWKKVAVITSSYHILRTDSMLEAMKNPGNNDKLEIQKDPELLKALNELKEVEIVIVSDEDILAGLEGGAWKRVFEKMKQAPEYKKRVEMESQGVKDLEKGIYGRNK